MTNKLVVIINSLKVPKIKKMLLYEIKFLVPNYSCLQNPWLGGYAPRSPFSLFSVLNWICWTPPPPPLEKKFLGTPLWGNVWRLPSLEKVLKICLKFLKQKDPECKSEFTASRGWFTRFVSRNFVKRVVMGGEAASADAGLDNWGRY